MDNRGKYKPTPIEEVRKQAENKRTKFHRPKNTDGPKTEVIPSVKFKGKQQLMSQSDHELVFRSKLSVLLEQYVWREKDLEKSDVATQNIRTTIDRVRHFLTTELDRIDSYERSVR